MTEKKIYMKRKLFALLVVTSLGFMGVAAQVVPASLSLSVD